MKLLERRNEEDVNFLQAKAQAEDIPIISQKELIARLEGGKLDDVMVIGGDLSQSEALEIAHSHGWLCGFSWKEGANRDKDKPSEIRFIHDDPVHAPYSHLAPGSAC